MSRRPKYRRVQDEVLGLASSLEVGAPLPAERSLAQRLGVSRMTLRRAVDELVDLGFLHRRQGSGTYVAEPKITQFLAASSFTQDMAARGLEPGARVVRFQHGPADADLARELEIMPGARVLRVARVRTADGEPIALEELAVDAALVPGLRPEDLEGTSFYELLRRRYGLRIVGGEQTMEAAALDAEAARLLRVPKGSAAFLLQRVSRDETGRVLEFVRSRYRGDRYRFTTALTPSPIAVEDVAAEVARG